MKQSVLFILCILLLTGCATTKEKVELLNKNQATRFAKTHFGKAHYKEIESQTDDRIDYIFIDDEYHFEYKISSYKASHTNIVGEDSGLYKEVTDSDFGGKYYDYIVSSLSKEVIDLEQKYNVSIKNNDGWKDIYYYIDSAGFIKGSFTDCSPTQTAFYSIYSKDNINFTSKESKIKAGNELASLVKKIDKRKYLDSCSIWVRDDIKNVNGVYSIFQNISLKET